MEQQGFTGLIEQIQEIINLYLYEKTIVWLVVIGLLSLNIIKIIISVLIKSRKREWDSAYFKWLALCLLFWTFFSAVPYALPFLPQTMAENRLLTFTLYNLRNIGMIYAPAFLCLHVWTQVSYRDITWRTWLVYFSVPTALSAITAYGVLTAGTDAPFALFIDVGIGRIAFYVFVAAMIIKTYLMMLNVFYQMPPHMRKSTQHMLTGISLILVAEFAKMLFPNLPPFDYAMLGAGLALDYLYSAFSIDSAANVIVTSRDFVFGNLSTMVIILSKRKNILDWNRKTDADKLLLPTPRYKEPFAHYYKRILEEGSGRVSEHDENIITTTRENADGHYLITTHEVRQKKRFFGYLVEISEVTKIYSVFRYLEEIAIKDQLTGLYNRNAYMSMAAKLTKAENMPLLIAVGDINNLKPINDIYGHLKGDDLLLVAAQAIKKHAPEGAFIARIGGDEFVMIAPRATVDIAENFIERVNLECSYAKYEQDFDLSISWGYAFMNDEREKYNDVFDKADAKMYAIKKERSRFHSSGILPELEKKAAGEAAPETVLPEKGRKLDDREKMGAAEALVPEAGKETPEEKELMDIIGKILPK